MAVLRPRRLFPFLLSLFSEKAIDQTDIAQHNLSPTLCSSHYRGLKKQKKTRAGNRPVTLVGFGMGARLVFKCLIHLAAMGAAGQGGHNFVLLGFFSFFSQTFVRIHVHHSYGLKLSDFFCVGHLNPSALNTHEQNSQSNLCSHS